MFEITVIDFIIFIFGAVYLVILFMLYFSGLKYAKIFEKLNDEDYPFHELYFVGYQVTNILKLDYKGKRDRKLRKELASLYDIKFSDYYVRVVYSQRFSMALVVMGFATPLYCFTGSILVFLLVLIGSVATYMYYSYATKELVKKKKDEYMSDFSEVVSKLALLVNSGMVLIEAWKKVAESGESSIFKEMQRSVIEIEKYGISIEDAINNFGQRCMLQEIRKFASTLIQAIDGNGELPVMLIQQSNEVWNMKKQLVRRQGELVSQALLIPMCLSFVGIIIMVIIPIFANIGA